MDTQQCEKLTILKILAGSHIHGLNIPQSDRDEEAIILEPLEEAFGIGNSFEELILESPEKDVKYVSLRKWCRLALKGNPNFLLALFAPQENILVMDSRGAQLRELREAFLSQQSIKSHLGYLKGQRHRMLSGSHGGRGKPRQDKIEEFGFDTKYAMHLIRLSLQGLELATRGTITLPVPEPMREHLLAIRHGLVPLKVILEMADDLESQMKTALDSPDQKLPKEPDYEKVEGWMRVMYLRNWYAEQTHRDIVNVRDNLGENFNVTHPYQKM